MRNDAHSVSLIFADKASDMVLGVPTFSVIANWQFFWRFNKENEEACVITVALLISPLRDCPKIQFLVIQLK